MPHDWIPGERFMKLQIQVLGRREAVKQRLQNDGWKLKSESSEILFACHAAVDSEQAARRRLHSLGLLTSATLRIEFQPFDVREGRG